MTLCRQTHHYYCILFRTNWLHCLNNNASRKSPFLFAYLLIKSHVTRPFSWHILKQYTQSPTHHQTQISFQLNLHQINFILWNMSHLSDFNPNCVPNILFLMPDNIKVILYQNPTSWSLSFEIFTFYDFLNVLKTVLKSSYNKT